MAESEISIKMGRVRGFLDEHRLDGLLLTQRNNFAWITGGKDNHIANNTPVGIASIYVTREQRICLANTIEAPRMRNEELTSADIDVIDFPWWDGAATRKVVGEVIAGKKVAADSENFGLPLAALPDDFAQLRWSLTKEEIARYRDGGQRTSRAMERACVSLKAGMSEHEIAGRLDDEIHRAGCNPVVTLIASDERIEKFRHPIPVNRKVERYVMLVTCAEFGGLISCVTRFVSFQPLSAELKKKQQAICNIDVAVNFATKPGRTLGDIFSDLQRAYAREGHDGQWKLHHQGGSTGYAGREFVATPGSAVKVLENQAFAWNPSVTGVKSEDTILCTASGIEVLTPPSEDWPKLKGTYEGQSLPRADILIL